VLIKNVWKSVAVTLELNQACKKSVVSVTVELNYACKKTVVAVTVELYLYKKILNFVRGFDFSI
jgi:hypothetical protein